MTKKFFLSTIFLCLGLIAKAEDTDVSQYDNVVFPVSTTGESGATVTVSVEMNNTVDATGFQFDIFLPDGITVSAVNLSEIRTSSDRISIFRNRHMEDGSVRVICSLDSGDNTLYTFDGSSGEVCTLEISIGESVAEGDYPIIFKNIEISDINVEGYLVDQVEATLTIKAATPPSYDEGYAVRILPFLVTEDAEGTFVVTNATALTNVEFDVVLPADFITHELYGIDAVLRSTRFSTSFDEVNGTTIHVSVARRSSSYTIPASEDSELAILGISYNDVITSGAHSITIKNIVLTDTDGTEYHAAPFTTYLIQDEYSLTMSYQWGTICLPYATQTTDDVQLFELSSVDLTAGVMKFSPVESLSANTPAIFKTSATNATFPVSEADEATDFVVSASTQADGWTAKGSYFDQELDPAANESDIYYISGDKFYYANQTFAVGTFRAWFETQKSAGSMAPSFSISFDEEAADLQFVEKADGSVDVVYNVSGMRQQQTENGINIINGKKVMTK